LAGDDHLPFVGDQSAVVDEIATFLTSPSQQPSQDRVLATVLCARMERRTSGADPDAAAFEKHVHQEVAWFRGRGLTPTPWGFFAAFDGPARAIACARALASASPRFGRIGHFGLHTGECDVTREGRVAGLAFDRAHGVSRVASGGEVLVSRTVIDLVAGPGVAFVERGTHPLTSDGDPATLFAAVAGAGAPLPLAKVASVRSSAASVPPPPLAAQPRRSAVQARR
jgi:class 3 adenylate cyclase